MKRLIVRRGSHSLPEIWTEDGEECASDRVFNGFADLMAASADLLAICEEIADARIDLLDSERRIRLYSAIAKAKGGA